VSAPQRFRKKPVEIEAMLLDAGTGDKLDGLSANDMAHAQIAGWMLGHGFQGFRVDGDHRPFGLVITTLEGEMRADPGDWIIRGVQGEFYPCKPDIFEQTYDAVVLAKSAVPEAPVPDAVRTKHALDNAIQEHARAEWNGDLVVDWVLVAGLAGVNVEHSIGIEESRDSMPAYISNGLLYEALHIGEYDRLDDGE